MLHQSHYGNYQTTHGVGSLYLKEFTPSFWEVNKIFKITARPPAVESLFDKPNLLRSNCHHHQAYPLINKTGGLSGKALF